MPWEHFAHDADIGIRGIGATRSEAFEQAALALTAAITDPAHVAQRIAVAIRCEAPDDELLLADWLNAIVYEMATRPAGSSGGRAGVYCARRCLIVSSCAATSLSMYSWVAPLELA